MAVLEHFHRSVHTGSGKMEVKDMEGSWRSEVSTFNQFLKMGN